MKIEKGLLILADWFDTKYPDDDNEVQEDLRKWSREISQRDSDVRKWISDVIEFLGDYEIASYMGGAKLIQRAEELGLTDYCEEKIV